MLNLIKCIIGIRRWELINGKMQVKKRHGAFLVAKNVTWLAIFIAIKIVKMTSNDNIL